MELEDLLTVCVQTYFPENCLKLQNLPKRVTEGGIGRELDGCVKPSTVCVKCDPKGNTTDAYLIYARAEDVVNVLTKHPCPFSRARWSASSKREACNKEDEEEEEPRRHRSSRSRHGDEKRSRSRSPTRRRHHSSAEKVAPELASYYYPQYY